VTLASNFGTFILYALSCTLCMVAYHKHPNFSLFRHMLIPVFGCWRTLAAWRLHLIGPFMGYGTPHGAAAGAGIAAVWALYGGVLLPHGGQGQGKTPLLQTRTPA
jgi:APA family basic amino acid/polyamine antiporter